jgi:hypothetical protein
MVRSVRRCGGHPGLLFDSPVAFSAAHLPTGIPFVWDGNRPARVRLSLPNRPRHPGGAACCPGAAPPGGP